MGLCCAPRIVTLACVAWAIAVYTEWLWRVRLVCSDAARARAVTAEQVLLTSVAGFSACPPDFPACKRTASDGALLREFGVDLRTMETMHTSERSAWCSFVQSLPNPLPGVLAANDERGEGSTGTCSGTAGEWDGGYSDGNGDGQSDSGADGLSLTHFSHSQITVHDRQTYMAAESVYRRAVDAFDAQCSCRSWLFWVQQPMRTERRAPELIATGLAAVAVIAEISRREELNATFGASIRDWMTSVERGDTDAPKRFVSQSWFYSCADESVAAVFRYVELAYSAPSGWMRRASYSIAVYAVLFSAIARAECTCKCDPSIRHDMPKAVSVYLFSRIASNTETRHVADSV